MTDEKSGWPLLHSKLPPAAIRALSKDVYGVDGLSDVNEAYLIQRLFASGLIWEWRLVEQTFLGNEDRQVRGKDYTTRYYMAAVKGELIIDGRAFHGAGASDNRKLDAAFKGAATVAFKNAAKIAGLTIELFKDGRAMDFIYEDRQGNVLDVAGAGAPQGPSDGVDGSTSASTVAVNQPASTTPVTAAVNSPARSSRSVGPQPKRTNVVTMPQGPEKPATAPEPPPASTATDGLMDDLPAPIPPVDDGLGPQRELVRQSAAEVVHVRAVIENVKRALDGQAPQAVPPKTPDQESDAALTRRIENDWPGRSLSNLGATELQGLLERLEGTLAKHRAVMAERGIKDE